MVGDDPYAGARLSAQIERHLQRSEVAGHFRAEHLSALIDGIKRTESIRLDQAFFVVQSRLFLMSVFANSNIFRMIAVIATFFGVSHAHTCPCILRSYRD